MDILKITKRLSLAGFIFLLVSLINAQSEVPVTSAIINAFKSSYQSEAGQDYTKSINALKNVYDKNNYEMNLRLGWLSYMNKQYGEAMSYYAAAINLMPYSIEAKFGYVLPASAAEKWEDVKKQYEDILKLDGMNSVANYRLGVIYYYGKDYNSAYKYFEKVVNSYPFDYNSILMFAWTNYQLGKSREAEVLFNKVLCMSPDDASALEGLGYLRK